MGIINGDQTTSTNGHRTAAPFDAWLKFLDKTRRVRRSRG